MEGIGRVESGTETESNAGAVTKDAQVSRKTVSLERPGEHSQIMDVDFKINLSLQMPAFSQELTFNTIAH
jgi:hypothetical protein